MSFETALDAFMSGRFGRRLRAAGGLRAARRPVSTEMSAFNGSAQLIEDRPVEPGTSLRGRISGHRLHRPDLVSVAALGVLVAVSAFLRLWRLNAVGFRGDEAVYAGQAALLAHLGGMDRWFILASRGNSNFLIYQWIVAQVYRVVGVSDTAARVVSATLSTLTVVLVYFIGRLLYDRKSAFLAGLILAVSGYAVGLGRLALLDSTVAFFITVAMFCLLKWHISGAARWLAGFGVLTVIATQAKVTSVLIIPIAVAFIAVTGDWRRLRPRHILVPLLLSVAALTPAAVQILGNRAELAGFLATSSKRASGVPWYFYLGQLWTSEGRLVCAVLAIGVLLAVLRRDARDLLPAIWLLAFGLFLQLYPLKGFNYLLPAMPPLALLAGRSLSSLLGRLLPRRWRAPRRRFLNPAALATVVVAVLIGGAQVPAMRTAMTDDNSAGMREAAYWLQAQGAQHAGAMTLSHGSGQYVLSFYAGIDSYPYGRFRIATVVPGGQLIQSTARGGEVPVDWVNVWPARLIEEGKVSYLVYNTRPLDDPPEQNQVASTVTERQFRSLIQAFGGKLAHVVYWHHEARVYIYRVSKTLAKPTLQSVIVGNRVTLTAKGFVAGSALTVGYHGRVIAHATADPHGTASIDIPLPDPGQSQYHVVVTDQEGNTASATGLPSTKLIYSIDGANVQIYGVRFTPNSKIRLSYGLTSLGVATALSDGTFRWSFRLPSTTHTRYRIRARDDAGHVAWAIGLAPPSVAFVESGNKAAITGTHYLPDSAVYLSYRGQIIASAHSDNAGSFRTQFAVPTGAQPGYQLIAFDTIGRRAGVTGLEYKK